MNFKDILDKFGPQQEQEIPFAPPVQEEVVTESVKVPNEPSVTQETPAQLTANDLLSQYAQPRDANYKAPRIQIPDLAKGPTKEQSDILNKLATLQSEYKTNLADAEDRKFKSDMLSNIGNILPTIVAGATAMNTKANVTPAKLPEMKIANPVEGVDKRFKTEYEGLLNQYKSLKEGGLTPKDLLYANIAQAQLDNSTNRLNTNIENTDRNAGIRVGQAKLKDQKENELSDKQVETIADYDQALASFGRTRDLKQGIDTGPVADLRNQLAKKVGWDDPKVTKLRSQILNDLSERIKQLSGTAASDTERKHLAFTLPSMADNEDTFNELLDLAETRVREAKQMREEAYRRKQGKNVEGYSVPNQAAQPTQKTVVKNERNKKTGQTRITYSDGTQEIK